MTRHLSSSVAVVVVIYRPDDQVVSRLKDVARGAGVVIAVNNGMDDDTRTRMSAAGILVVGSGENIGLAKALNIGLETAWALKTPATHVLFLDQDSQPAPDMAVRLQSAFETARCEGLRPACVAPRLTDIKARSPHAAPQAGLREIETAATSGTLTSREVICDVGGMMEGLFIDCIDHEWSFRAKNLGYRIYQDSNTEMLHDMGESAVNVAGIYKPMYRSPVRHFYIVRNTILLFHENYVPTKWKILNAVKTCYRIPAYILASADRRSSIRLIARAMAQGVARRSGPLAAATAKHGGR
jgi:rhamnosyltransferase